MFRYGCRGREEAKGAGKEIARTEKTRSIRRK